MTGRQSESIPLDARWHRDFYDIQRTAYLESQGYKVIRFWNAQVMEDIEGVIRLIEAVLNDE